jgi:hypothetical protein
LIESLKIHSERYTAAGNQAASGVRNQLGRPELSQIAILIRESVQNSWDARIDNSTPVIFGVRGWEATDEQRRILREVVFRERPPQGLDLSVVTGGGPLRLMTLYDRGTVGLTGPTRADVRPADGGRNNFNNLLRNIGSAEHDRFSGGTYGFGKAALYSASRVNTNLVHTSCRYEGSLTQRFIGSALGAQYDDHGVPFTGRHWWGDTRNELTREEFAEPVLDADAAELAKSLGMLGFESGETGTSILIVDPEIASRYAVQAISNVMLWNFWPKMIPDGDRPGMRFRIDWNGVSEEVPDPRDVRYLRPFVDSLQAVRENERGDASTHPLTTLRSLTSPRYSQKLGTLGITPVRDIELPHDDDDGELGTVPVDGPLRHVALMRRAELVVRYQPGDPHELPGTHYGGVFLTDPEVDAAYASSEPPTHDDWAPQSMETGRDKTLVNVGLRRIREEIQNFARRDRKNRDASGGGPALGELAETLADLLPGEEGEAISAGTGSGSTGTRTSGSTTRPQAQLKTSDVPVLTEFEGNPAIRIDFELTGVQQDVRPRVTAVASAAVDEVGSSTREVEAPAGSDSPEVLGWVDPAGQIVRGVSEIDVERTDGTWSVFVRVTDSAAVRVDLNVARS